MIADARLASQPETFQAGRRSRAMPRSQKILLRLVSLLAGIALAAVLIFGFLRDNTPRVTQPILNKAKAQWRQAGITSYDLEVRTTGGRQESFVVQVRDGEVTSLSIEGNQMPSDRLGDTWLVDRQFDYIQNDLRKAEMPKNGGAMRMVGVFDPEFGYPQRYRCWASDDRPETSWEVTRFRPVKP